MCILNEKMVWTNKKATSAKRKKYKQLIYTCKLIFLYIYEEVQFKKVAIHQNLGKIKASKENVIHERQITKSI